MRPIIGMIAEVDDELSARVQIPYVSAIEQSGGLPILLPYVDGDETIEKFVDICDGFFFTGGKDIDPKRYGEEARACEDIQYNRDELEFKVFQRVINTSKPILAVCRGLQLVNVALGGTLYQDIPSELDLQLQHRQSEPKFSPSHDVNILASTPLSELMGVDRIKANSFHHQAVKALGKGLAVMALSDDGVIEAAYLQDKRYLRAYQWHPERLCKTDAHNRLIFEDFIKACHIKNDK